MITEAVQQFAHTAGIREVITAIGVGRWLARCGFMQRKSRGVPQWTIPARGGFLHAIKREGGSRDRRGGFGGAVERGGAHTVGEGGEGHTPHPHPHPPQKIAVFFSIFSIWGG